jgi:hypothetical protein
MNSLPDRAEWRKPMIIGSNKKTWMPSGNYESVNSQGSSSSLKSEDTPDPHRYRLHTGDD